MRTRSFGNTGVETSVMGYGAMPLSLAGRPSDEDALAILEQVLAAGVQFLDTADTYCLGPDDLHHNEQLIARSSASRRPDVIVATKGGTRRSPKGWLVDGDPEFLARSIEASFAALGGHDPIPLWQLHWPDPRYSLRDMLEPAARAVEQGMIRWVGVCNFTLPQLQMAADYVPVVSVQNQFNFWHREAETEGVLEYCEQNQLVFLPWRPMGGPGLASRLGEVAELVEIAREREVSPHRVVLAWLLRKSPCVLPIPGSRDLLHIRDCLAASELSLTDDEVRTLDALGPSQLPTRVRPAAWEDRPPLNF